MIIITEELTKLLNYYGLKKMVIAHNSTDTYEIEKLYFSIPTKNYMDSNQNYYKYNIKKWFRQSLPDEIFYAIYMGENNIKPLDFEIYKIQQTQKTDFDEPNEDFYFYHEHSHLTIIREKILKKTIYLIW